MGELPSRSISMPRQEHWRPVPPGTATRLPECFAAQSRLPPSQVRVHNAPPMPRSTIVQEKCTALPVDAAQRLPTACLRPFISRYGGFRISGPSFGATRGLPSRHVTVMVGLGDPFRIVGVGSFTSFVAGLHDSANVVDSANAVETRGDVAGMHLVLKPLGTVGGVMNERD